MYLERRGLLGSRLFCPLTGQNTTVTMLPIPNGFLRLCLELNTLTNLKRPIRSSNSRKTISKSYSYSKKRLQSSLTQPKKGSHDEKMQTKLLIVTAALSFASLITYVITRERYVLDSAFSSLLPIMVGYYFGKRRG